MPPDPDMIQSADEDDNSDPFADVKIDEDIDNAMKSWEGLMDKKLRNTANTRWRM